MYDIVGVNQVRLSKVIKMATRDLSFAQNLCVHMKTKYYVNYEDWVKKCMDSNVH